MPGKLSGLLLCVAAASALGGSSWNFTVTSWPVKLRYGEVHNKLQWDPNNTDINKLPQDVVDRYASGEKIMAITGFDVEMFRLGEDGTESLVPINDHYVHHYLLYFGVGAEMQRMYAAIEAHEHLRHMVSGCHGMRGNGLHMLKEHLEGLAGVDFGSAAGAEFRHNPQRFQKPFALLLRKPEVWAPTLHIINTNLHDNRTRADRSISDGYVSRLLECPCTPQRQFDLEHGTIDGKPADPPIGCSPEFAATGNPSCNLSTYVGGWRCCEHGMFLVDTDKECANPECSEKPLDEVFMRFTFYYEDATAETRVMEGSACCDVTSDGQGNENIEYDVPACAAGTPPHECIHVAESVQPVGYFYPGKPKGEYFAWDLVDLVFAAPHLHWAGTSIELIDDETNEVLCEVHQNQDNTGGVMYGTGNTPGNERGYLTGLKPCTWGASTARRMRRDHKLRTRAIYNATSSHTGVMSLWLMQVSPVPREQTDLVV